MAAITTKRSGLPWYIVFMRQTGYERALDQAVEAMAAGSSLGDVLALVVAAVERDGARDRRRRRRPLDAASASR